MRRKGLVGGAFAVAAVAATVPQASGHGPSSTAYIGTSEVSLANNRWHGYSFFNNEPAWKSAMADVDQYTYEPTDLSVTQQADYTHHVDVRITVQGYGTSFMGWVMCPNDAIRSGTDPSETCFKQWLKIDLSTSDPGFPTSHNGRKSLLCHEFGHTLGLRHNTGTGGSGGPGMHGAGCMDKGAPNQFTLHSSDVSIINSTY